MRVFRFPSFTLLQGPGAIRSNKEHKQPREEYKVRRHDEPLIQVLNTNVCIEKREYSEANLKQLLICTAIELDSIRGSVQSQMQLQEAQIAHLEKLLERVRRERVQIRVEYARLTNKLSTFKQESWTLVTGYNNKCISTSPAYDYSAESILKNNSSFLSSSL